MYESTKQQTPTIDQLVTKSVFNNHSPCTDNIGINILEKSWTPKWSSVPECSGMSKDYDTTIILGCA